MFSKAKMGVLLGTMAAVLSIGTVFAAETATQTNTTQAEKQDKGWFGAHKVTFGHFSPGHSFSKNTDLLALLKLDEKGLQEQLQAGKSLADIAKAQGVSEDAVIQLLTKAEETKLDQAVKDGKLTQDKADKAKASLAENLKKMVESTHQKGDRVVIGHGGFFNNADLLTLLKLDEKGLQEQLKAGKSLADVAKAQSVTEDAVIQLLTKAEETGLAQAVKDGKLTQEKADQVKAGIADKLKKMVESTHQKGERFGKGMFFFKSEELLTALKLDQKGLQEQLKAGKSLAEIAGAQGVSEDSLIQLLTKAQEEKLAALVKEGKLTQEKADEMKTKMADAVKKMVEKKHDASQKEQKVVNE